MLSIAGPLLSSLTAQRERMANSAHNIANLQTSGFRPLRTDFVERAEGGVDAVTTRPEPYPAEADPVSTDPAPASDAVIPWIPAPSHVDLAHELSQLKEAELTYQASAAALGRTLETLGSVVDAFA